MDYQLYLINKMAKQEKTPMTRPMPKTQMGITKIAAAKKAVKVAKVVKACLLYTSPSPRDGLLSRMPSSA